MIFFLRLFCFHPWGEKATQTQREAGSVQLGSWLHKNCLKICSLGKLVEKTVSLASQASYVRNIQFTFSAQIKVTGLLQPRCDWEQLHLACHVGLLVQSQRRGFVR